MRGRRRRRARDSRLRSRVAFKRPSNRGLLQKFRLSSTDAAIGDLRAVELRAVPVLGVLACAGVQVKCLVARGASRTIYFIEIYERNDVEAHDDHPLEHVCAPGFCDSKVVTHVS